MNCEPTQAYTEFIQSNESINKEIRGILSKMFDKDKFYQLKMEDNYISDKR